MSDIDFVGLTSDCDAVDYASDKGKVKKLSKKKEFLKGSVCSDSETVRLNKENKERKDLKRKNKENKSKEAALALARAVLESAPGCELSHITLRAPEVKEPVRKPEQEDMEAEEESTKRKNGGTDDDAPTVPKKMRTKGEGKDEGKNEGKVEGDEASVTPEATGTAKSSDVVEVVSSDQVAGKPDDVKVRINMEYILKSLSNIKSELVTELVGYPNGVGFLKIAGEYESLILQLVAENERLRVKSENTAKKVVSVKAPIPAPRQKIPRIGSLGVPLGLNSASRPSYAQVMSTASVPKTLMITPPKVAEKPRETWSVRVTSTVEEHADSIRKKIVEQVGPSLGVRVHTVQPSKKGGVIIRTPTLEERNRIIKNEKFKEVGLVIEKESGLGRKLSVFRAERRISPKDFIRELHRNHFDSINIDDFLSEIRIQKEWQVEEGTVNFTLECSDRVATRLVKDGRCYIKHFSFIVREHSLIQTCFKCLSMDHLIANCRQKQYFCNRCGQAGHTSKNCCNGIHCRDCDFRGQAAGHLMLTKECPVFAAAVARRNANH